MNASRHEAPLEARDWPNSGHSRVVTCGGIGWHVQIMGSGPPLLLLHGTGASTHSFRALMPLLAERFTVVAPDLPGHAFSRAPSWFAPSLPAMASALKTLLVTLDVVPTVAVGHSAGAALIARMALDRTLSAPLLVGLGAALVPFRGVTGALFPPTARLLSMVSKVVALRVRDTDSIERMLGSTGSQLDAAGIELYRRLSERPGHVAAVLAMMARWDLEPLFAELPRLHVRFLLLAGELDRAVPMSQQRAIVARTPGARLEIIPQTGHLLHEEQPEVVARFILDEVDAAARANQDQPEK